MKKGIDLLLPVTDFNILATRSHFNLIISSNTEFSQKIKVDTMLRGLIYEDNDYDTVAANPQSKDKIKEIGCVYFDIDYIRECALKKVVTGEWKSNYGPTFLENYLDSMAQNETPISKDSFVKVICLTYPDYSLKKLNKEYAYGNRIQLPAKKRR